MFSFLVLSASIYVNLRLKFLMVLSREDLRNQLKRREIAPIYLLFGPETHLRDLAAKTITDLAFAEGDLRDFNETTFSLINTEDNLQRALAAADATADDGSTASDSHNGCAYFGDGISRHDQRRS